MPTLHAPLAYRKAGALPNRATPAQLPLFSLDEPADRVPEQFGPARVGVRETARILHDVSEYMAPLDYSLNPYVGCSFGCSYCYAVFFAPEEEQRENWGRWVDVKVNGIREIMRRRDLKGKKILMSSATDPYQPIERTIELTRGIVEALSEPDRQPVLRVQTRGPLVARDIDVFKRFENIRVNMSITTDSDEIRKRFEPSCASIDQRFEAIEQVKAAGIRIGISLSPLLPIEDIDKFADRLVALEPDSAFSSSFHISHGRFKGSTRTLGLELASEFGWTKLKVQEAVARLRERLPMLV
jgi:DNA repair photolyase